MADTKTGQKQNSTNATATLESDSKVTKSADTSNVTAKIINAQWSRKIDSKDTEVGAAKIKETVKISLKSENITDDTEIVISVLDAKDSSELTIKTVKIRNNKIFNSGNADNTTEVSIEDSWSNKSLLISVNKDKNSILGETYMGTNKLHICCCEHTIMIGDTGNFIEELHIRLCGFGGIQPYQKVSDKTIASVKQFQKDYMKVEETGYICKHILEKLDEFRDKYSISFNQLKCTCGSNDVEKLNRITGVNEKGSCSGFGNVDDRKKDVVLTRTECAPTIEKVTKDGKTTEVVKETTYTIENEYSNYVLAYNYKDNNPKNISKLNKEWIKADSNRQIKTTKYITKLKYMPSVGSNTCYEYPGMHRSLMWAYKAIAFYLEKEYGETDTKYTINKINSGYRCRYQDTFQDASLGLTFNHMGTALDIHFDKNGTRTRESNEMDKLRDEICVKYIGASKGWKPNKLGLELASHGATSWIHIDVREFSNYKADKFFKTTEDDINGGRLSDIIKTMDDGKYKPNFE